MERQGALIAKEVFAVDVRWENLTEQKSPRQRTAGPDGLGGFILP
jgi:hypothetical protein